MNTTEKLSEISNPKEIINKVIITGYLGKDPTLDTIGVNTKVAKFNVATNHSYKNMKGETISNTLWHNITAWNKLAVMVHESLKRGNHVTIEGRINYNNYTDKNGVKKVFTEIVLNDVINHSKKEAA